MFKNLIYFNILFIFGLLLYLLSLKLDFDFYSIFYLFFCIFAIVTPSLFLCSDFEYTSEEDSRGYKILFWGFVVYGVANLIWYFNEAFELSIPLEYVNVMFLFQVFTKHYFLRYLTLQKDKNKVRDLIVNILSVNLGILVFAIFLSNNLNLSSFFYDFYFIFESIFSIFFITFYLGLSVPSHVDLKYFLVGNFIWLLADISYLSESYLHVNFMGNISDFAYYLGFYVMLASIIFKNFTFLPKLDNYFEKNLSFS